MMLVLYSANIAKDSTEADEGLDNCERGKEGRVRQKDGQMNNDHIGVTTCRVKKKAAVKVVPAVRKITQALNNGK